MYDGLGNAAALVPRAPQVNAIAFGATLAPPPRSKNSDIHGNLGIKGGVGGSNKILNCMFFNCFDIMQEARGGIGGGGWVW